MMNSPFSRARWRLAAVTSLVASATLLGACASGPSVQRSPVASVDSATINDARYGTVRDIEVVPATERRNATGAVLGGVIGAIVGNQVGSGSGRAAATGVGAVAGAAIGHQIQKRNADDIYRVTVRFDNGDRQSFDVREVGDLRVGERVRYDGELHRAYG